MGNKCTVFNNELDNNNWDLSSRVGQNNPSQDSYSANGGGTKVSSGIRTPINNKFCLTSFNCNPFYLEDDTKSIISTNLIFITSFYRGYIFRKKYKDYIKTELMDFANELYFEFMSKIKNQKVSEILEDKVNNKIPIYLSTKWSEFYQKDPTKEINDKIIKTSKYINGLRMTYNDKNFYSNDLNFCVKSAVSCYRGVVELFTSKKCGPGELVYSNGKHLIGQFYNDEFNGWNTLVEENGTLYVGLFINNSLNGKGLRYTVEKDHIYKGDFSGGLREGYGVDQRDTSKYTGEFKKDKKNGKGEIVFFSGDKYIGEFKDNKFCGYGHYIWKDGQDYKGYYLNGKFHGEGYHKWGDNEYYHGNYKNGVKEGEGEIGYKDGKKIVANFVNGEPTGLGLFTDENGQEHTVEFCQGTFTVISRKTDNKK